jgi:hypothetical protein
MDINDIRNKISLKKYTVSFSHTEKVRARRIRLDEIEEAILNGRIIEPYPEDLRGPSCLIFGFSNERRPLHVLCGNLADDELLIVTAYEPDPEEWEADLETRKGEM